MRTWAESNGYAFANKGSEGKDGSEGAAPTEGNKKHPVTKVSWRDCIVWCNAYTQKMNTADTDCVYRKKDDHAVVLKDATKDSECDAAYADMSKKGYRLPTEAEWEYAARWQGSDSTNAEQYGEVWLTKLNSASGAKGNWEDTEKTGEVAWYRGNADSKTHPVGTKKANALGLHDMSGNVWEWCFDRYDNNPTANDGAYESGGFVTDPQGAASGAVRVMRECEIVGVLNGRDINKVLLPVITASYVAAVGTITRRTAPSVNGTTTTPIKATTILAFVWLCPRIDVLVNSWTRVLVASAYQNVAIAWNHRPPWRY